MNGREAVTAPEAVDPREAVVTEETVTAPAETQAGKVRQDARPVALWVKLGWSSLVVVGLVAAALGLTSSALIGPARLVLTLAGLVLAYVAGSRAGRAWAGPGFDLLRWCCVVWLALLVLAAVVAPLLPLAEAEDAALTLAEPIFQAPVLLSDHPLGTNGLGLDLLARVIYGARVSLTVSISAVIIGTIVGSMLGVSAGYLRGKVDVVVGLFTNTLLAVPALILLVALATVLRPSPLNMALALSLVAIPGLIRVTRANALAYGQREFVTVAHALGAKRGRIIFRELMPNVLLSVLPLSLVYVSALIVAEASLSFLGIGLRPPQPTWGNMIAEGLNGRMEEYPHLVYVPAAVLFLTVFSLNLLGERMRKRWDKREVAL